MVRAGVFIEDCEHQRRTITAMKYGNGLFVIFAMCSLSSAKSHEHGIHEEINSDKKTGQSLISVLLIALQDEGDGARLMLEAAAILTQTEEFNCSVIIVGRQGFPVLDVELDRSVPPIKIYRVPSGSNERKEQTISSHDPLTKNDIATQISACNALLHAKEVVQHFQHSPPKLLVFPGFLQDACVLNMFRGSAAVVWSTGATSSAWLGYSTNAVPFSTHQTPLQYETSKSTLEKLQATWSWSTFTNNLESQYWNPTAAIIGAELAVQELNVDEAYRQVALLISASHPLLERPVASLPMRVTVGCFHCRHSKPLPPELQEWVIPRRGGMVVILLPKTALIGELLIITARDLPQFAFLWLGTSSSVINETALPSNLVIHPACPEQDAIGHSRARLVMSECSDTEVLGAVFHGVPLMCLPRTFDQLVTSRRVLDLGVGVTISAEGTLTFADTVKYMIGTPSYRYAARHLGVMMRDEPETAADRLIFWLGHVARHWGHGHEHAMRSARQTPRDLVPLFNTGLLVGIIIGILITLFITKVWHVLKARRQVEDRIKSE